MRRIIAIAVAILLLCPMILAAEEEFSYSAQMDYGYDERYNQTAQQNEVTSNKSDNVGTSYDEKYDETTTQSVTSDQYDNKDQSYSKDYDERITNGENKPVSQQSNKIRVILNGKQLTFDVDPTIINSRTMVPMRVIFEALGMKVNWDAVTRTAIGETEQTTIKIAIGKSFLQKNDSIVLLDSPAVILSGRTLVPVRAIAESLDCTVNWYGETRVVEILK